MSRYHSYLNSAKNILSAYKGREPFALYIKKYFAQGKKYGSTDRKQISHLCYCYFRLGKALENTTTEEKILAALFICSEDTHPLLQELAPIWNEKTTLPFSDKAALIGHSFSAEDIFPWTDELSNGIEPRQFILSHVQQPDLFLRIRPGNTDQVKRKLTERGIQFKAVADDSLAVANSSKIDGLLEVDAEVVVQDFNSQRVGEFIKLPEQIASARTRLKVWDCCAASGGKSIMAKDILGEIDLMVSDVRESILINLRKRFARAGIKRYESFIADLTQPLNDRNTSLFNLIIADLPCTGSGTWSRTPEQLAWFEPGKIEEYAALQKKIIDNIIPQLEPGGLLLYITCSVFRKENEEQVDFMEREFHLQPERSALLKGYDKKADSLFVALLRKPL